MTWSFFFQRIALGTVGHIHISVPHELAITVCHTAICLALGWPCVSPWPSPFFSSTTESWQVRSITTGSTDSQVRPTTPSLSRVLWVLCPGPSQELISFPRWRCPQACLEFTMLPQHVLVIIMLFGFSLQRSDTCQTSHSCGLVTLDGHKNLELRGWRHGSLG